MLGNRHTVFRGVCIIVPAPRFSSGVDMVCIFHAWRQAYGVSGSLYNITSAKRAFLSGSAHRSSSEGGSDHQGVTPIMHPSSSSRFFRIIEIVYLRCRNSPVKVAPVYPEAGSTVQQIHRRDCLIRKEPTLTLSFCMESCSGTMASEPCLSACQTLSGP